MRLIAAVLTGVLLSGGALANEKYTAAITFCPKAALDCVRVSDSRAYETMDDCVSRAKQLAEEQEMYAILVGLHGIPYEWSTRCLTLFDKERKA